MSLLDFTLPGSDPNAPNSFVQSPEQVAARLALARSLSQEGDSYAPVQSPWQGAARLAQALAGAVGTYKGNQAQRLGTANAAAEFGNALGSDPGTQNIAATPGQTTAALQTSDQRNDAISDGVPNAALAAAIGGSSAPAPTSGNSALATALGGAPQGVNPASRGMRNNNPGNLEANAWTESLPGYAGTDGRFAIFSSPQAGQAALDRNLSGYGNKGISTPLAIASTWAPGSERGNNPNSYGAAIAQTLGVGLNDHVNMSDPATRAKIGQAIALVENGPGPAASSPAVAAINSATGAGGAPVSTSPAGLGASPPGGPQGAGVSPTPAPSQADLSTLATAMNAAKAPQPGGVVSPANAAAPYPSAALAAASGLHAPAPAAPQFTPPPAPAPTAPAPAPQQMASAAPAPPPSGQSPQVGSTGFHPDMQGLLNVLSDPWATPAQQQIAQQMIATQMPTPPTFGVIGKDAITGNEQYGWINPKTQTVTPASGGAPAGAGGPLAPLPGASSGNASPAGAPPPAPTTVAGAVNLAEANGLTPQGAQYLNGMEQQGGSSATVARQARSIIEGNAPLPEGTAATKPIDVAVRDAVLRAAPGFNSSLAAARVEAVKSFADKTSPSAPGGMILAANKALHHLAALSDSANQLGNLGSPTLNWIGNTARDVTVGNPAMRAYEFNKEALAQEVAKIYKGGSPAEAEIHAMVSQLSPNMTRAEQAAVFAKVSTLLQGATTELQRQWQTAFGPNSTYPVLGEEGQRIAKRFSEGGAPSTAAPGVPNLGVGETHSVGGVTIKRLN